MVVDDFGSVIAVGYTQKSYFPTTEGCLDPDFSALGISGIGAQDGFVMRLSPDGSKLWYSTFLGAWATNAAESVALSTTGDVLVGGRTRIGQFYDTIAPFHARADDWNSAFSMALTLLPKGTQRLGRADGVAVHLAGDRSDDTTVRSTRIRDHGL